MLDLPKTFGIFETLTRYKHTLKAKAMNAKVTVAMTKVEAGATYTWDRENETPITFTVKEVAMDVKATKTTGEEVEIYLPQLDKALLLGYLTKN